MKRKLAASLLAFLFLFSTFAPTGFSLGKSANPHKTGLRAPTQREAKLFKDKSQSVVHVLPTEDGLKRINETRQKKSLKPLPSSLAAADGQEIISDKEKTSKQSQKLEAIEDGYGSPGDLLPAAVDLSLSGHFPTIGDQGYIGSCASFATTYYAATYETAARRNIDLTANPNRILSPRFIYNLNNDGEDAGSSIYSDLMTLYTRGAPFIDEASMADYQYNGYDFISGTTVNPLQYLAYPQTADQYNDALKNRIADLLVLSDVNTADGLSLVRQMINNGHALVFGTDYIYDWKTDKQAGDDPATAADDGYKGQRICYGMQVQNINNASMHAMTVVGYSDDIWVDTDGDNQVDASEKGALKIANSWGAGWMNGGYIWLSYSALRDGNGYTAAISGNEMIGIIAQDTYVPKATAEITVTTARRSELWLYGGANWNEAGDPAWLESDYVFSAHWGGNYSFAGTSAPSTATVVVDLSDAILADGMDEAGGMLSLFAGVEDDTSNSFAQTVSAVTFKAGGRTVQTIDAMPASVNNRLAQFCGKAIVNQGNPPAYNATIDSIGQIGLNETRTGMSSGPQDLVRCRFIPAVSGTYRIANSTSNPDAGLMVQNSALNTLYQDYGSMTVTLYAGKTYVVSSWYEGAGSGLSLSTVISLQSQRPVTSASSRLGSLSLGGGEALSPDFDPGTFAYSAQVGGDFRLAAVPEDADAYVVCDDKLGGAQDIALPGSNAKLVRVEVTSKDWLSTSTYMVLASHGTVSADASLSSLLASAGTLDPAFDPAKTEYSLMLPADNGDVTITAQSTDANASIWMDGVRRNSARLFLQQGGALNVSICVVAQDPRVSRTYTLHVSRKASFTPGSLKVDPSFFTVYGAASSPYSKEIYLLDNAGSRVFAADLRTGSMNVLSVPYPPKAAVFAGGMLLVSLAKPVTGADTIAVIDPSSFSLWKTIDIDMDISGIAADYDNVYPYDSSRIDVYNLSSGSKTSAVSVYSLRDLKPNDDNGRLYGTTNGATLSFQVADGHISLAAQNTSNYGNRITVLPDGRNLLLDDTVVLSCDADAADDLAYVTRLIGGSLAATDAYSNELYVVVDRLIHVYDASSLQFKRVMPETQTTSYLLAAGNTLVKGQKDAANAMIFEEADPGAVLQSLKLNGEASTEFYPLHFSMDWGEVPNSVSSVAVDAVPAAQDATVAGDVGTVPLAVGKNDLKVSVRNQSSGATQTYTVTITRSASDPAPSSFNGFTNLGFKPLDSVFDEQHNALFLTEVDGKSLYRVDLATGAISEKKFPLTAERLTLRNDKVYLTLLRTGHHSYGDDGYGAIAVVDAATFQAEAVFNTNIDPYDIEVDGSGVAYLSPGSSQWSVLQSYHTGEGQLLFSKSSVRAWSYLAENFSQNKLYSVTTDSLPADINAYELLNGKIAKSYDSPYHGDYAMSEYMVVSPDGSLIFNSSGNLFSCAPTRTGDMVYSGTLGKAFTSICFDMPGNRFFTANSGLLTVYDYASRAALWTMNSPDSYVNLFSHNGDLVALMQKANGTCYVRQFSPDLLLSDLSVDGLAIPGFDPHVKEYSVSLPLFHDTINISATVMGTGTSLSGSTGVQPFALGLNTYQLTLTNAAGKTAVYTLRVTGVAPGNAYLSDIRTSAGSLTPAFDKDTFAYTLALSESTPSVTITPVKDGSGASMTIDGAALTSKNVSVANGGFVDVKVCVTASDGVTKRTYTVRLTRAMSTNASLSSMGTTSGTWTPAFSSNVYEYNLLLPSSTGTFTLVVSRSSGYAAVRMDGNATTSASFTLSQGESRSIAVQVTAQDGVTVKTYTIHASRCLANNADLAGIALSSGTLTPAFQANTVEYSVLIPTETSSVTITPKKADTDAWLLIDGTSMTSKTITLANGQTRDVAVRVISADMSSSAKTYTLHATRDVVVTLWNVWFNSMGGNDVPSVTARSDATIPRPADPTRTGYTFRGWYKDSSCTSAWDFAADKPAGNITLYAGWTANTYTVVYDANGGTGETPSSSHTYEQFSALSPNGFVMTGHQFEGWSRTPGAFPEFVDEQLMYNLTPDANGIVRLYACWGLNAYTVSFNSSGGTAVDDGYGMYGESILAPAAPTRTGYAFAGWYPTAACDTAAVSFPYTVTGNVTLYAKWNVKQVTVTFNNQDGWLVSSVDVAYNSLVPKPADPARAGYAFRGWYRERSCTNAWNFAVDKVTDSIALYTGWTANTYTVIYNANGGSGSTASSRHTYGQYGALTHNGFTKPGYTFGGWSTQPNNDVRYQDGESAKDLTSEVNANVTLYACWFYATYTVTYNSTGGSAVNSMSGLYLSSILEQPVPTRTGYTFEGWYPTSACNTAAISFPYTLKGNVTFYAKWKAKSYTVTFNSQGGSQVPGITAAYGTTVAAPTAPTRTGYTFGGWYTNATCTTPYSFSKTITGNITLYAKWTITRYTIGYNLNGGTVSPANPASYTIASTAVTLAKPKRTGYTFMGWSGTGITGPALSVTIPTGSTGNRSYAANWKANTYTVTYNGNGATRGITAGSSHTYGSSKALTANGYTRTGYKFVGWAKSSTGAAVYTNTQKIVNLTATNGARVTLYARWMAAAPQSVKAVSATYNSVRINWAASAGASGYEISRATSAQGTYTVLGYAATSAYTNTGLTTGKTYYYKVRAYCLVGSTKVFGGYSAVASAKPLIAVTAAASDNAVKLTWEPVPGATYYEVSRSVSATGGFTIIAKPATASFKDASLSTGKVYYYRVRAYNGTTKAFGPYSAIVSAKRVPAS